MSLVSMSIKRKYFDAILDGTKRIEYREVKPFWARRLEKHHVTMLRLTAGYSKRAPSLIVGVDRIEKIKSPPTIKNLGPQVYAIHLGTPDLI